MITPEREKQYRKTISKMTYLDDDFFNGCLQDSPKTALLILRIVLRKPDLTLVGRPETQKTVKNLQRKSVRFDLFCASEGKYYDVEIQRRDKGAGAHRARYYSSLIDAGITVKGEEYGQLPDTYVIFITQNDIYGKGLPYYTIERTVEELGQSTFGDGAHILYVNGAYEGDDDFGQLMHDMRCTDPNDIYYPELKKPALFLKETEKGVEQMCEAIEKIAQERSDERAANMALIMIRNGEPDDKIILYTQLTAEQVEELRKGEKEPAAV